MVANGVWKPVMYGGFAGLALGVLLQMAGWTSAYPGICALQFASILGCGIGGGLVVAYGPARSLAWLLRVWRHDAAKLVAALFFVTASCIPLFATTSEYDRSRIAILLFDWLIVLLVLLAVGPKACDTAIRRWGLACLDALVAVYGPFVVDFIQSLWQSSAFDRWQRGVLEVVTFPGGLIIQAMSAVIRHRHTPESATLFIFADLLSVMVTVLVACWVAKWPRWRWWLPFFVVLCSFILEFLYGFAQCDR